MAHEANVLNGRAKVQFGHVIGDIQSRWALRTLYESPDGLACEASWFAAVACIFFFNVVVLYYFMYLKKYP